MARHRSPNYPAHGLSEAVEFTKQIYAKEKRSQAPSEIIAKALGYSSLSGNARVKIASLKKYGLLEGDESRGMRVSDLAMRILYPGSPMEQSDACKTAAITPTLFKTLFDDKKGASDEALVNHLVSRLDFSPVGAKQAIEAFRDTIRFAGLEDWGYSNSYTSEALEAQSVQTETKSASAPVEVVKGAPHAWYWTLSVPRGVNARLTVDGPFSRADFTRLKKQIEFLEESFDEEAKQ